MSINNNMFSIDTYNLNTPAPVSLYLCDGLKHEICLLPEAINKKCTLKLSNIHELDFSIPLFLDGNIRNNHADKIMGEFFIKLLYRNYEFWFIISQIEYSQDSDGLDYINVTCYSSAYELGKLLINSLDVSAYTIREMCNGKPFETNGILKDTMWQINYISPSLQTKYRSATISNQSVLEALSAVAKAFNAILVYDDIHKRVNFYDEYDSNINVDRGLILSDKNYINGIQKQVYFDEVKTRCYIYGKDGMSINNSTPTGSSYIENFDFYMTGFEQDSNGNVIASSIFGMSDELCKAQIKYKQILIKNQGLMDNLISRLSNSMTILSMKQSELSDLETDINTYDVQINTDLNSNLSTTLLVQQRDMKVAQYNSKNVEISNVQTQIVNIKAEIKALQATLSLNNNFTPQLLAERNKFVREMMYNDENYDDESLLYKAGQDAFLQVTKPRVEYTLDIIDFLESVSEKKNWNKIYLGDIVTINFQSFGIDIQARIIQMDINFEENTLKLTISSVKDLINNVQKLIDSLYQGVSSSTSIDNIEKQQHSLSDDVTTLKNILSSFALNSGNVNITVGNGSTTIKKTNGITSTNLTNSNEMIRLINGKLYYSTSGEVGLSAVDFSSIIDNLNNSNNGNTNGDDTLSHFKYSANGAGYYNILDNSGRLNVQIGSNNGVTQDDTGGQVILYNGNYNKKRVFLGIDSSEDSGELKLLNNKNNTITSVGSNNENGEITLFNELGKQKIDFKAYSNIDNTGKPDTNNNINNGGTIQLTSNDGAYSYFIKVDSFNNLVLHDINGNNIGLTNNGDINFNNNNVQFSNIGNVNFQNDNDINFNNSGVVKIQGNIVSTQNWVTSQNYITNSQESSDLASLQTAIKNWVSANFQPKS